MDKKSGRWPQIYWTGIGSKISGIHSKKEFLDIVHKQYPETVYRRFKGDKTIPFGKIKKTDIDSWIEFTGARWIV